MILNCGILGNVLLACSTTVRGDDMTDERWDILDWLDNFGEFLHRFFHSRTCSILRFVNFVAIAAFVIWFFSTPPGSFTAFVESIGMNVVAVGLPIVVMVCIAFVEIVFFLMKLLTRDLW